MLCFDECTYYPATYQYTKSAMLRTHRWAVRCLKEKSKVKSQKSKVRNEQALYGVVQGGVFRDLREESARFISGLPFDGIAIGGVSVGESKKEMIDVLDWVVPLLPKEKPRHLLGVGEIDDIFNMVKRGIDTFDCVMPTRLGRMGKALVKVQSAKCKVQNYKNKWLMDITKSTFKGDSRPIEEGCQCKTCKHYSRAYLNHLFRNNELLGYRLLTYHNLYFVNNLVEIIRQAIKNNKFEKLKKEWLK